MSPEVKPAINRSMFDCDQNSSSSQSFIPKDSNGKQPYIEDFRYDHMLSKSQIGRYNEWLKKQGYKAKYQIKSGVGTFPVPRDPQAQIDALWRGLSHVLLIHKCPPRLRALAESDINKYLSPCSTQGDLVSHMKYILNFPIARYLGCPEPLPPTGRFLTFHKTFYRWLKKRIDTFSVKNTHLFSSWLQCKRSCLPTETPEILEAYKKHFNTLTTECTMESVTVDSFVNTPAFVELINNIKNDVREELNLVPNVVKEQRTSVRASCENTRSEFGQHGSLLNQALARGKWSYPYGWERKRQKYIGGELVATYGPIEGPEFQRAIATFSEELDRMDYHPCGIVKDHVHSNIHIESRVPCYEEDWVDNVEEPKEFPRSHYPPTLPQAICTGVLEPLKVRMISKGDPKLYYRCKKVQLALHKALKKYPIFNLIGRPQSPTDLIDILPDDLVDMENPLWISADYSGATDGLNIALPKAIFNMIFDGCIDTDVMMDSYNALFEHEISYDPVNLTVPSRIEGEPDFKVPLVFMEKEDDIPGFPGTGQKVPARGRQSNGQLMGGILSFIFLCLSNAAVQAKFMHDVRKKVTYQEFINSCKINGDDLLTVGDGKEQFEEFSRLADLVGFKMTVGKSYYHPIYANINSQAIHFNLNQHKKWLSEVLLQSRAAFKEAVKYINVDSIVDDDIIYYDHRRWREGIVRKVVLHQGSGEVTFKLKKNPDSALMQVPREVPFLNMGLFFGQHKVMERVGGGALPTDIIEENPDWCQITDAPVYNMDNFDQLPSKLQNLCHYIRNKKGIDLSSRFNGERPWFTVANVLLRGSTPEYSHRLCHIIVNKIRDNNEDIAFFKTNKYNKKGEVCGCKYSYYRRNIFLPVSLGGLGVRAPNGYKFKINSKQRQLAYARIRLHKAQGSLITRSLPIPGKPNREISSNYHPLHKKISLGDEVDLDILDITELDVSYRNRSFYNRPIITYGGPAKVC